MRLFIVSFRVYNVLSHSDIFKITFRKMVVILRVFELFTGRILLLKRRVITLSSFIMILFPFLILLFWVVVWSRFFRSFRVLILGIMESVLHRCTDLGMRLYSVDTVWCGYCWSYNRCGLLLVVKWELARLRWLERLRFHIQIQPALLVSHISLKGD
jgi:hypothetical protein